MFCIPLQRTSDASQAEMNWSPNYLQTVPGKLKCICLILLLFGFICEQSSSWSIALITPLYHIVFWFAFDITALLLFAHLFNVVPYYNATPWDKIEYYFCFGTAIALSVCTVFMILGLGWITIALISNLAAAFAFAYDAFSKKPVNNETAPKTDTTPGGTNTV